MKFISKALMSLSAVAAISGCGAHLAQPNQGASTVLEAWDNNNDPFIVNGEFKRNLSEFPANGEVQQAPWSDTYWPSKMGGISYRWNSVNPTPFNYTPPSLEKLKQLSASQVAALSPAEKYDIFQGRYDYPTVRAEFDRTNPKTHTWQGWEGLCHGWSPAAMFHKEPLPITKTNADGIQIPFGSSDVKALLTHYYGVELFNQRKPIYKYIGVSCKKDSSEGGRGIFGFFRRFAETRGEDCKGINAGAFHIALANLVGLQKKSFVIDIDRGPQIWNQPVVGYSTRIVSRIPRGFGSAPDADRAYLVKTQLAYQSEVAPHWDPRKIPGGGNVAVVNYSYRIEVDSAGNIVGGKWMSGERPNFAWTQESVGIEGYYSAVSELTPQ